MTARTSTEAFAQAAAGMVANLHVGDILNRLVADCAEVTSARAVAILVRQGDGSLNLLTATSRSAGELEMLQSQSQRGPCVEVLETGRPLVIRGADSLSTRWDGVGTAIVDAGFAAVEAYPMLWHGEAVGGLNLFWAPGSRPSRLDAAQTQAFADVATVALMNVSNVSRREIASRVHTALESRQRVEQAKGVLMHLEGLDAESAHRRLEERARAESKPLTVLALEVLGGAGRPARS